MGGWTLMRGTAAAWWVVVAVLWAPIVSPPPPLDRIPLPPPTSPLINMPPHRAAPLVLPCCWPAGTTTARRCKCGGVDMY